MDTGPSDRVPINIALQEHSAQGAEILYSEPAPLIKASIFTMCLLVVAVLAWSFIGRADIIVAAPGALSPEDEVRRIYTPADGELDTMLVSVGDPVTEGDELARITSKEAVALAADARQAALNLATVELKEAQFERQQELRYREQEEILRLIGAREGELDRQLDFGALQQDQRARLAEARNDLLAIENRREQARTTLSSYEQLVGRGISAVELQEARLAFQEASAARREALARIDLLETQFIDESARRGTGLAELQSSIAQLRNDLEAKRLEIDQARQLLDIELLRARAAEQAAREIRLQISAQGNVLGILAPVSGVVTSIGYDQAGDKVPAASPLLTIAPRESRKVLKIAIPESERGFLDVGQPVKAKFNAFPYQRYGFLEGTLEYISPTAQAASPDAPPAYEGHVSLTRDYIDDGLDQRKLQFGMTAVVEIVVRQRRLIDMALDPIRGI